MKTTTKLLTRAAAQKLIKAAAVLRERVETRIEIGNRWNALDEADLPAVDLEIQEKRFAWEHKQAEAAEIEPAREAYDLHGSLRGDVFSLMLQEKAALKARFIAFVAPWLEERHASEIFQDTRQAVALEILMRHHRSTFITDGPEAVLGAAERLIDLAGQFDKTGSFLPEESAQ